jgi:protease YdgD
MPWGLAGPIWAQDSCEHANDNECDEARYGGTGACGSGTDSFDCGLLAARISDDSCEFAYDGECDEPRLDGVSTACRDGTDATDCRGVPTRSEALEALLELLPQDVRARLGTDSCEYAFDLECDDAAFGGTGACSAGTDAADCRGFAAGGDESCRYAGDGECDESGIGTGMCTDGTDTADCQPVVFMRNRDNTCDLAFDGQCNETAEGGDGQCVALSDTADCLGRLRPAQLQDHFFGRDDRYLVNATAMPFRAVGLLTLPEGNCTGSLVGPRTVLTAAHCVTSDGVNIEMPLTFDAGLSLRNRTGKALVVDAEFAPDYNPDSVPAGQGNGEDWALVTLDRDLGYDVGWLPVHVLTQEEIAEIGRTGLNVDQAGYSWDTGYNLSGNRNCRITAVYPDNSIQHECDTTFGDSGSPLLLQDDGIWKIVAVESQFFDPESKHATFSTGTLAVDSRAFADAVRRTVGQ